MNQQQTPTVNAQLRLYPLTRSARLVVQADEESFTPAFPESYASANVTYERAPVRGLQYFSAVPDEDVVGKPYRHQAADMQVRI